MRKLGKNVGGYQGETIDIEDVLLQIQARASASGWVSEALATATEDGVVLPTWHRAPAGARFRLYLSAGIHGDEPAGPLAALQLVREDRWPASLGVWLCPCLNPAGFRLNRRENAQGVDLNRQYLHPQAAETRAHVDWLKGCPPFDVALCLHEDWESHGFYLYELNLDQRPSHAEEIIRRVQTVCPIDGSPEIEGRPAVGGIVRPSADPKSRPQWPEAFWLVSHRTQHTYTLEAPSDFPLATRVSALVTAVRTVLDGFEKA